MANELKIVISRMNDFDYAEKCAQNVAENCRLYLQPEWSVAKEILPHIVAYIKNNRQWFLSLQTHKYIGLP